MISIRIVCSHDAVKFAETLRRLLEAEQHRVRLSYGRQALHELEDARSSHDAVILIWSPDARSQTYMLEWARSIDAARLVEIARASDWPQLRRRAPVIDFTPWRGERGARSWKALNERLGAVARMLNPPKAAPARALIAVGFAGAAAVAGAIGVRMNAAVEDAGVPSLHEEIIAASASDHGMGGPLVAVEPASLEDDVVVFRSAPVFQPMELSSATPLAPLPELQAYELRDRTLLERLNAYNPLRRESGEE
jgi:hypothetical protein